MNNDIAKAGSLILTSQGEYSDYGIEGLFTVVTDFYPHEELKKFLAANPDQQGDYNFEYRRFLSALLADGKIRETPCNRMHLGNYGCSSAFEYYAGPDKKKGEDGKRDS